MTPAEETAHYDQACLTCGCVAFGSKQAHMRPAAIAGASGGFPGIALQVLREAAFGQEVAPAFSLPCDCPSWSGHLVLGTWTSSR